MTRLEKLFYLNNILLNEMPHYKSEAAKFSQDFHEQRRLFRSLSNLRPAMPLDDNFLKVQNDFLAEEVAGKGVVDILELTPTKNNKQLYLWQGDITRLKVDAIVNAANSALLGCFVPCHGCIDNAIHSLSGLQLRRDCDEIIQQQGHEEKTGLAKITKAYNLPCKFVIHTVGPIINGRLTQTECDLLADCYKNCLNLAISQGLNSIAFCCISTGEFHFPSDKAADIAINTVKDILKNNDSRIEVIFNVFKNIDYKLYRKLLREDS